MSRRRKHIPMAVKRVVVARQDGLCSCGCGEPLAGARGNFDHNPPLELREWDEGANDTIPPANDPNYIDALIEAHHHKKTDHPRGPHTVIGSDRHKITQSARIARGGHKRKWRPVPGSKASAWHKPLRHQGEKRGTP